MSGSEPDGIVEKEQSVQSSCNLSVINNSRMVSSLNRPSGGCSECAAAKANAYKAGMALVAHMDELQRLQKKLKEKEDLLKVYSARDSYIDEMVSKNEQLEDELSRLRMVQTELKETCKRQEHRIAELSLYERNYQDALALKELNLKLKETLEKSEERRESMKKKYEDSVLFAEKRVKNLVEELKEATSELQQWKARTSNTVRMREASDLIYDLVSLVIKNGLSSESLRQRCEEFMGVDTTTFLSTVESRSVKRSRAISQHSLSATSDDDDVRELENLMQEREKVTDEPVTRKFGQRTGNIDTSRNLYSNEGLVETGFDGSEKSINSVQKTVNHDSDLNAGDVKRKESISTPAKRERRGKMKSHSLQELENAHSKFLSRRIGPPSQILASNTSPVSSSIIGRKTKTIKEQQKEMIAKHREQKLAETLTLVQKDEKAQEPDLLEDLKEKDLDQNQLEDKEKSSFLDDFILSSSDDEASPGELDTNATSKAEIDVFEEKTQVIQESIGTFEETVSIKHIVVGDESETEHSESSNGVDNCVADFSITKDFEQTQSSSNSNYSSVTEIGSNDAGSIPLLKPTESVVFSPVQKPEEVSATVAGDIDSSSNVLSGSNDFSLVAESCVCESEPSTQKNEESSFSHNENFGLSEMFDKGSSSVEPIFDSVLNQTSVTLKIAPQISDCGSPKLGAISLDDLKSSGYSLNGENDCLSETEKNSDERDNEAACFCYEPFLMESGVFLLEHSQLLDSYVPKPTKRKLPVTSKSKPSVNVSDYRKISNLSKDAVLDIQSAKVPAETEFHSISKSEEVHSLTKSSSPKRLFIEEPLSPEIPFPNSDSTHASALPQFETSRDATAKSDTAIVQTTQKIFEGALEEVVSPGICQENSSTTLESVAKSCRGSRKTTQPLMRKKIQPMKGFHGKSKAEKSNLVPEITVSSPTVQFNKMVLTKADSNSRELFLDNTGISRKRISLAARFSKNIRTLGKNGKERKGSVKISTSAVTKKSSEKQKEIGEQKQDAEKVRLFRTSIKSLQVEPIQPLPAKRRREAEKSHIRYDTKNSETAVLSLLDDLLIKKARLEDVLLKFREMAIIRELGSSDLASYLVKYANDVNTGKVPWQSLISLVQKGKSLHGNLVELINQLCAENQWRTLGFEFYRQLCLSFVRSNQVFNASRHLNVGCCLILTSSALSMDSEDEGIQVEIKTLLVESLKYSIGIHPSEWVVPLICLALKFVPHLVKDFFSGTSDDDKSFCELISIHLAAKASRFIANKTFFQRDYLSTFKSLWNGSANEELLCMKAIDSAKFHSMLSKRKEEVLGIKHGFDTEINQITPQMGFAITSFTSMFAIADSFLFPEKIDFILNFLAQTLSSFSSKEETLYSITDNNSKERNVNALILCAYILRVLRATQRLNTACIVSLQKLAFHAYQLHQRMEVNSQEVYTSTDERMLRFSLEQLLIALQV